MTGHYCLNFARQDSQQMICVLIEDKKCRSCILYDFVLFLLSSLQMTLKKIKGRSKSTNRAVVKLKSLLREKYNFWYFSTSENKLPEQANLFSTNAECLPQSAKFSASTNGTSCWIELLRQFGLEIAAFLALPKVEPKRLWPLGPIGFLVCAGCAPPPPEPC